MVDLRALFRSGFTDATLESAIREAIARKPQRNEFEDQPGKIMRIMSQTGG